MFGVAIRAAHQATQHPLQPGSSPLGSPRSSISRRPQCLPLLPSLPLLLSLPKKQQSISACPVRRSQTGEFMAWGLHTRALEVLADLASCTSLRTSMHFSAPTVFKHRVPRRLHHDPTHPLSFSFPEHIFRGIRSACPRSGYAPP